MQQPSRGKAPGTLPRVPSLADACGEIPNVESVVYSVRRLVTTGYFPRFDGYLRQLGFDGRERASAPTAREGELRSLVEVVGARTGWLRDPVAHASAVDCGLLLTVGDDATSTTGVQPPDPAVTLDWYASLPLDARSWVGVDPHRPESLQRALALREHEAFAGLALTPYSSGRPLDDPVYDEALLAAVSADIPVWVHTSAHFWPAVPVEVSHPRHVDSVLTRHAGLRIVMGHAGWPWTDEACVVALRHAGAALEFSTFPPRLLTDPGWSLTPLLAHRGALSGRIFFGSGAVSDPRRFGTLVKQLDDLPLGADAMNWRADGLVSWLGR